jgi:hypothetical protein
VVTVPFDGQVYPVGKAGERVGAFSWGP